MNFLPKSAAANDTLGGEVTLTYGSYEKRNLTAPVQRAHRAGHSRGRASRLWRGRRQFQLLSRHSSQPSAAGIVRHVGAGDWSFAADYMYYHSNGDVQTPGWNRLTQALIDNGTYITGRNTSLKDADGNGRLTLNELGGNPYTFDPNFHPLACVACQDAAHRLDSGLRHHHARSAHRLSGAGRGFLQHHHPYRVSWKPPTRWAMARPSGCRSSATCCRMTGLSPMVFPVPIAPRFSRRGCATTSIAISGPSRCRRWRACPGAMFMPSARKASTAASSRWTAAISARARRQRHHRLALQCRSAGYDRTGLGK